MFNFKISSLVPPLTTSISCPFVPENDPTTAVETAVAGCRVRLSKCIVFVCPGGDKPRSTEIAFQGGLEDVLMALVGC